MSILGNRVLRTEDPRFLTVGGSYTADLDDPLLDGALHATYVRSMVAHGTITSIDLDEARRAPGVVGGLLGRRPRRPAAAAAGRPAAQPAARPSGAGRRQGPLRRRTPRRHRQRDARRPAPTPPSRCGPTSSSSPPCSRPRTPSPARRCCSTRSATTSASSCSSARTTPSSTTARSSSTARHREPAGRRLPARGPVVGRHLGRRPPRAVRLDPGAPRRQGHAPGVVRPRRADQVRVKAPDVGGGFGPKIGAYPEEMLLGWLSEAGRPSRPLDRDPLREHGRHGPRPWPVADGQDRRHPRRQGHRRTGSTSSRTPGAYPALGAFLSFLTRVDDQRRLRHPGGPVQRPLHRHQHHAHGRLPRRGSARGHRGHRAGHGPVRRRDRHGPGRGPPSQPDPGRRLPVHHARPTPSTTSATTSAASTSSLDAAGYDDLRAEQARRRDAGDVRQLGIGVSVYVEVTAGPTAGRGVRPRRRPPRRLGHRVHRIVGARPGPRHQLRHAGHRRPRHPARAGHRSATATPTRSPAASAPSGRARSSSAAPPSTRRPGSVLDKARQIAADLLEADPADIELDRATGVFHVAGTPAVSRTWAEVATAAGDDGHRRRDRLRVREPDVPLRRPRRRGRGRHRDRRGPPGAHDHLRRRRHHPQPAARRGPAPRRHRPGRGPGALRARAVRRRGQPGHRPTSPTTR